MTDDQRWLLLHMGGWQIVAALCSSEDVTKLMQSCWGSSAGRSQVSDRPNAPAWLKNCGWDTSGGTITARGVGVKVKAAEINRYAKQIPDDIKAELLACRNAGTANAVLKYRFCRCGSKKCGYGYLKDRICPPTDAQEREADDEYWRIIDWQDRLLPVALGLNADAPGQLQLFGASA
jgi:hypothetical protein